LVRRVTGLRKGVVVNIEATVQSIRRALEEAELMAACQIGTCSPVSPAVTSRASTRAEWWRSRTEKVAAADVARVIETAKAVNIPTDQQVLHVLTQEFIVDGQEDIASRSA
jgi:cell division protein FtsA